MAEIALDNQWELSREREEEQALRLHQGRSYLRSSTEILARNVAGKLNEEVARGHDTFAFLIALTLAIFKDSYDIIASLAIKKAAAGILGAVGSLSAWAGVGAGAATGAAGGAAAGLLCGGHICSAVGGVAAGIGGAIVALVTFIGGTATGVGVSLGANALLSFAVSLIGLFLSLTLYYFLWGKGWFLQKMWIKVIWWVGTLFLGSLPGIRFAPIESLNVLNTWRLVRKRAHKAEKKLKDLKKLKRHELEELDEDITKIDEE